MDNSFFLEINSWKVLIDPWLEGAEIDFVSWFNKQWHRTAPISYEKVPEFDTVLITQKYPDHFHVDTLKKLSPKQIIAPKSLGRKLRNLFPNAQIILLDSENNRTSIHNVQISFLPTKRKIDPIYDAFLIDDGKESVFIATHGFNVSEKNISLINEASPCKLLITPFNRYELPFFLGGTVSPGLDGVKHLCEILQPQKVVATHDEDKYAQGLVSKFAKITRFSEIDSLEKYPWLKEIYIEINNYKLIQIS